MDRWVKSVDVREGGWIIHLLTISAWCSVIQGYTEQNVSVIYSGCGNPRKRLQHLLGTVCLLGFFFSFSVARRTKTTEQHIRFAKERWCCVSDSKLDKAEERRRSRRGKSASLIRIYCQGEPRSGSPTVHSPFGPISCRRKWCLTYGVLQSFRIKRYLRYRISTAGRSHLCDSHTFPNSFEWLMSQWVCKWGTQHHPSFNKGRRVFSAPQSLANTPRAALLHESEVLYV